MNASKCPACPDLDWLLPDSAAAEVDGIAAAKRRDLRDVLPFEMFIFSLTVVTLCKVPRPVP